jgi:hypothetical protein
VAFLIYENRPMQSTIKTPLAAAAALTLAAAVAFTPSTRAAMLSPVMLAQAMVPPTGMMDAQKPTPMEQRYLDRYPQPALVGDLIGLPVFDLNGSTLGYVRQIVRTPQGKIELIVSYSWWWGWFGRLVAVPLEAVGIEGRQFVSLDMKPGDYAAAPTWHDDDAAILPADTTIRVALGRA